jgi:very-short-patch-repair endonuclease
MKCWECDNEGTVQFDLKKPEYFLGEIFDLVPASQRWYCEECFERISTERQKDRTEYIRLKKKLMLERAVRMMEKQDLDLYEYKEALDAIKSYSEENPDKFDSSHEMVAAAVLIYNEVAVKTQYKVAGYRVDFYIPELNAILEVDGNLHNYTKKRDSARDLKIKEELGNVEIVRIKTKYIEQNAELLVEAIKTVIEERHKRK